MICTKLHSGNGEKVLAACDAEIVGMTFRGNGMKITVSASFYDDGAVEEEVFIRRMKSATIMNLVGERTVTLAIQEGYADPKAVLDIGGVKHVQVVNM